MAITPGTLSHTVLRAGVSLCQHEGDLSQLGARGFTMSLCDGCTHSRWVPSKQRSRWTPDVCINSNLALCSCLNSARDEQTMFLPCSCTVPLRAVCEEPICGQETPTKNLPFGSTETRAGCRQVPPLERTGSVCGPQSTGSIPGQLGQLRVEGAFPLPQQGEAELGLQGKGVRAPVTRAGIRM